jgi:hypothetical protein
MHLSPNNKNVLKQWLQNNLDWPYASDSQLQILCSKTGLEIQQIQTWLRNQRKHSVTMTKKMTYFTEDDKMVLRSFFLNKSKHPGPLDLDNLVNVLKKDKKKIRSFFEQERFKENKKNMLNANL